MKMVAIGRFFRCLNIVDGKDEVWVGIRRSGPFGAPGLCVLKCLSGDGVVW